MQLYSALTSNVNSVINGQRARICLFQTYNFERRNSNVEWLREKMRKETFVCALGKLPREREKHLPLFFLLSRLGSIFLPYANRHCLRGTIEGRKRPQKREESRAIFFATRGRKQSSYLHREDPSPRISDDSRTLGTGARRISLEALSGSGEERGRKSGRGRKRGCTGRPWLRNYLSRRELTRPRRRFTRRAIRSRRARISLPDPYNDRDD